MARELVRREQELGRDDGDRTESLEARATAAPFVDIYENNDEILVVADLPGVAKDDVEIRCEKDRLTLSTKRKNQQTAGTTLAAEFRPLDFRREFILPRGIDTEKIEAKVEAGVLRVHLPKSSAVKTRQIPIRSS